MNEVRKVLRIDEIHRMGITGKGIVVAVIDTGVYAEHVDLKENVIAFQDIIFHMKKPYDDNGHGTHVAGIIAGRGYASDGMYKGIAPDAGIVVVKALNRMGKGKALNVIKAIRWIEYNYLRYNIRIVNISVGTIPGRTKDEEIENRELLRYVERLWELGIVVVVAAGNNGPDNGTITIPGISKKVITVGMAEDCRNNITEGHSCSGRGPADCIMKPEIVAPGVGIISCSNRINSYTSKSGTSMATPVVSGIVALYLSKYPYMTNKDVKKMIMKSAVDLHFMKQQQGWGRINPAILLSSEERR